MKYLIAILIFIISYPLFSQTQFSIGFKEGYKSGYCHNDYNCPEPITPSTPSLHDGESFDNYMDGYNRGFKMGLEDKQNKKSNLTPIYNPPNTYTKEAIENARYYKENPNPPLTKNQKRRRIIFISILSGTCLYLMYLGTSVYP